MRSKINMNRLTLRISLWLYVVLALFVGGVGYYVKVHLESETEKLLRSQMESIATVVSEDISGVYMDYLAAASAGSAYITEMRNRLNRFSGHFKLTEITVSDIGGLVFVSTDTAIVPGSKYLLPDDPLLEMVSTPIYMQKDGLFMKVSLPLKGESGGVKGVLSVEASADYFKLLVQFERFFVYAGASLSILLFVGAWLISSSLTRPIRQMSHIADRIGSGEFGVTVKPPLFRDEIRLLAESVNKMSMQLKFEHDREVEQVESLRILAAGVAHEVRNPIQGISLYADRLHRITNDEKISDIAKKIKNETRQVGKIIEDLIDFTRPLELSISSFRIADLIHEVTGSLEADTVLMGASGSMAFGDRSRLKQVFANIIKNGVEAACDSGPKIAIKLSVKNGLVSVCVHNSGNAIDNDTAQKLFRPFFTTKPKGTGLGLALCRKIMLAHDGNIEITKSELEGFDTCVTVSWVSKGA